jgi:hypothetical protein
MNQCASSKIVDDAIDGISFFKQSQRNRTVRDSKRVVVRPVDRIQDPRITSGQRNRRFGIRQFFAEEIVFGKLN